MEGIWPFPFIPLKSHIMLHSPSFFEKKKPPDGSLDVFLNAKKSKLNKNG